jgi:hypothetical protein
MSQRSPTGDINVVRQTGLFMAANYLEVDSWRDPARRHPEPRAVVLQAIFAWA